MQTKSFKEQRIRKITKLYYSRKDVQKVIFEFCQARETVPSYMMESFGKRPDALHYQGDLFELAKKGATSFHCSEELWRDPLQLSTNMSEDQLNKLRIGWDLLIDIDSKYIDYSKIMAKIIIGFLRFHGIKNLGVKFSGSKGFHILVPWKAFPEEIAGIKTSNMFPQWPRIITQYLMDKVKVELTKKINELFYENKYGFVSKYIKREGGSVEVMKPKSSSKVEVFTKGMKPKHIKSEGSFEEIQEDEKSYSKEVIPDLILVSPRHLFRSPYSLHEKTALASVVIDPEKISSFDLKDADPMKVKIKDFKPKARQGEAKELVIQALDWHQAHKKIKQEKERKIEFKPVKLEKLSSEHFPPCIKNILKGLVDGQHRSLFALINLFRSLGMDKEELEKRIYEWNKKNKPKIKDGYIKAQLAWNYKRKPLMPPNCKEFYKGIGVCQPDNLCNLIKNPTNYAIKKNLLENRKGKSKK